MICMKKIQCSSRNVSQFDLYEKKGEIINYSVTQLQNFFSLKNYFYYKMTEKDVDFILQ